MSESPLVRIEKLSVVRDGREICALPELTIGAGERLVVSGDNGTGKSTLLRVLAGLEANFGGTCAVPAEVEADRVFVHQEPYLFRGTVLFNVMYGLRARGQSREAAETTAREWLGRFGLSDLAARPAKNLSGGERRRVALARAMACTPRLLLLDEPLAEMDTDGAAAVWSGLATLPDTAVVLTSPRALENGAAGGFGHVRLARGE